ncbi:transketolase [Mycoplasmopsis californica]|uniref:Transketolase n=2 Tax=Mycoplasmopsis californica TaxID=2113 RepID=A0A059XW08_9BACT|nr:1-deoxy-D-xylulose-5-phosphate synthase N-terminal domain-containing protein [Mycoplasmopsis californica]AIA29437.1 transketolase [Mycoplasmopsis californica]
MNKLEKLIASMRGLVMDAVNNAKSGHSGMAIGSAEITATLFTKYFNFTNLNPKWLNRDKFILSAGHGSLTIYTIMHFMGLLDRQDIEQFRKYGSRTSGHPEIDRFQYIDVSTGALGQGIANGLGMALGRDYLAKRFNKPDYNIIDHTVYVLHGDGCLQEGVALEAIQLAGTLQVSNFVLIHDFNKIQIDTPYNEVNNIDFKKFFEAQKFNVIEIESDPYLIEQALLKIKDLKGPTYLQIHTNIAKYTDYQDSSKGHAALFTPEQTIATKKAMSLDSFTPFEYDDDNYSYAQSFWEQKNKNYQNWLKNIDKYTENYPELSSELQSLISNNISYDLSKIEFSANDLSTREYSGQIVKYLERNYWSIVGGSADLFSSTKIGFSKSISEGGQGIKYGIREHAMCAINNGINLATNLKTLASTFLAFADYSKGAMRLASLMELPVINVYSHDTYMVGEDGPTHQPVEQLTMLRSTPNMVVIRPCDQYETEAAFAYALNSKREQISIITSRQNLKTYTQPQDLTSVLKTRLIIELNSESTKSINLLASGSEVEIAVNAAKKLNEKHNLNVKVYSVPVLQFLVNDTEEIAKISNHFQTPLLAIEASNDTMWYKIAEYTRFRAILAKKFGCSGKGELIYHDNGLTVENIIDETIKMLEL